MSPRVVVILVLVLLPSMDPLLSISRLRISFGSMNVRHISIAILDHYLAKFPCSRALILLLLRDTSPHFLSQPSNARLTPATRLNSTYPISLCLVPVVRAST